MIASAVFPLVREVWPEAEIGVVTGSWSRAVLQGHPLVRWVHTVDHWKLIRSGEGRAARFRRYAATRRRALAEIREVGYDVAVDLHPFFPNAIPLLWQAGIPVRAGYTSAGFAPLLTHPFDWEEAERHQAESHRELLARLDARFAGVAKVRYSLPPLAPERTPGGEGKAPGGEYLLLHMGAGLQLKEWPAAKWHALAGHLLAEGHTLVFTGAGAAQAAEADRAIGGRAGCHNLCDRLSWNEFAGTVAGARLVVSVDSVAGHLAAGAGVPAVVLTSGMNPIVQWRPLGERVRVLTHATPCAPCNLSEGCAAMECIREVTVEEVLAAVREELAGDADGRPRVRPDVPQPVPIGADT
ncbi:MAG: glycosyltransferase family 9 protein [Gemmatimonadetes bacterium]|nr:glycosyltransferase family 9 protein [Gemmatimonadota bacterium]